MPNPWYRSYLGLNPSDENGAGGARVLTPVATFVAGSDPITGVNGARCDLDLTQDAQAGNLLFVQAVYLDFADIASNVSISLTHLETGFRVKAKGVTQGWYPFVAANTLKFTLSGPASIIGTRLPVFFANTPAQAMQWPTA